MYKVQGTMGDEEGTKDKGKGINGMRGQNRCAGNNEILFTYS